MNQVAGKVFKDRRILKDRRVLKDRRKQPPPASSPFQFWWQRKTSRREEDRKKNGIDLYSGALLLLIVLILGLDLLDSLFPKMVLGLSGWEANPMVHEVIEIFRDRFWVAKVAILSVPLVLLCIHSKFKLAISVILGICLIKIAVLLYQFF